MLPIASRELEELLKRFKDIHILVVGDFFLDKYLFIDRGLREVSLETGLEAHQIIDVRCTPGAAGTVTSNLRVLNVRVSALGVIGEDGNGYELKRGLLTNKVNITPLIEQADFFTPTYTKPMVLEAGRGVHEIERQDIKNRNPISVDLEDQFVDQLNLLVPQVDGVIVVDQVEEPNCGVITDRVRTAIGELAIQHPEIVIAVDSRARIGQYENIILKPNHREVILASQTVLPEKITLEDIKPFGYALIAKTKKPVFVTLGEEGILVFTKTGCEHVPAVPVHPPIDIVGAGDSCMAAIVSSLCSGAEPAQAAFMGNLAASITIQRLGTTGTASAIQMQERFNQLEYKLAPFNK